MIWGILMTENNREFVYVSELFGPTIQGEGRRAGNVSIFLRLAQCNMQCAGFGVTYNEGKRCGCDSYYAVDTAFKPSWEKLDAAAVIEKIQTLSTGEQQDIVITGGEPLVYWKNTAFQMILEYFISKGHCVTVETNGSIVIELKKEYQQKIIFSVSLKLKNSGEAESKRINIKALETIFQKSPQSYLKFVVQSTQEELDEIKAIEKKLHTRGIKVPIYLMPMCSNKQELGTIAPKIAQMAIENNYCYTDRLHIRLWDDKRGV
jgi:organic radical activating enzyme